MKKQEPPRLGSVAAVLVAFVAAWAVVSNSQSEAPASFVPTVTATNPADGATGVAVNQKIAVTFSQHMSPASLSASLIVLRPDGSMVNGHVNLYYRTGVFIPSLNLAPNTRYTARVRAGASDLAGVALGHAFVWSFTTGATSDTTKPTVIFTNPANSAVSVPTNQRIIAMFSKEMSPGSLSTATFMVTKPGGAAIIGTVAYASASITFLPSFGLRANTHYIATITTGAKDIAGNPLASNYVWSFDTGANSDLARPTVTSTNPESNATLVPIDQKVNATFSKAMNYATITTGDFLLTWSGGHVVGTVSYFYDARNNLTIATFVPAANLLVDTLYTATITNEAQDLSGNALAGNEPSRDYVWRFTTGATAGQSTVALGAAANFAILAAAGVANTSTPTTITGDLGLWPGTSVTGFPPGIVNGTMHVNDPAAEAGEAALTIAYNDAAGRVGAFTPAVGNVGGLTFTPGLYRSGTSTEISGGGDLTLDAQGDPNAVFIFQIASTLTTSSGFGITLKNGAKSSQIFWQVGSSATIGTGTHFAGNILAKTSITLVSGAVLDGRALAGAADLTGAVTMDDNTVVRPAP
jgi:methionine-rich copper-binding protein CopC